MSNPESYSEVVNSEFKKFQACLDSSYSSYIVEKLEAGEITNEELEKIQHIYTILSESLPLLFGNYVHDGPSSLLCLYPIEEENGVTQLGKRPVEAAPKYSAYTSSLRALLQKANSSYFLKTGFAAFGLEPFRKSLMTIFQAVLEFLKYLESVGAWTEKYLTWLEYGADLLAAYDNDRREGDDPADPSTYYSDPRVRLYAALKTVEMQPKKFAAFLCDLDGLIKHGTILFGLVHRLYVSIESRDFDNLFNLLDAKQPSIVEEEDQEKFQNLRELNEYIQERIKQSVEAPDGFVNVVETLMNKARESYISQFVNDFMNLLNFYPSAHDQQTYVKRFERGKLCPENSG